MYSSGNSGYGAVGFSIQSQDSNAGNYGAPAGSHFGAFYHGGGGGFLNNGPIGVDGNPAGNDQPIAWSNGGISSAGVWYLLQFTATAKGSNKFDLKLRIYNTDVTGAVGSLLTEHTMTDDMGDATRVGPAITNANVAGASTMRVFFSAEGTRMTQLDDFRIQLSGGATYVANNSMAYSATTFTEAVANDGSIATTSTITLNGDTFTGTNGDDWSLLASNVPDGLTAVLTRTSDTTATLSLTGNATSHANADDIANLTVTFTDGYFTGGSAANIAGATTNNLVVDFNNPPTGLNYSATTFAEAAANDGTIATTSTITLTGDTFTGTNGDDWSSLVSNVPAGLTAVLTRTSATTATLSFTGNASSHANADDIANLTVTFTDGYFTGGSAAAVTGATTSNLEVDFADPNDSDGVADAVENAAPNGGDGNGDGTADNLQSNVASLLRPDGSYLTLATDCVAGMTGVQTYTEASQGGGDGQYNMPYGLVGFSAACETATFTVYYHGVSSVNGMTYRKYGPVTPGVGSTTGWYSLPQGVVTYGTATVGGQTVATATFTLHDNQLGDDTGDDGLIVDQGGPGNANAIAPVPTLSEWGMMFLSGLMALSAFAALRRRSR